jgi:hypothetical protein
MGWTVFNSRFGGRQDKPNTDGIMGLADKPWFTYGTNTDEKYYNPPSIVEAKKYLRLPSYSLDDMGDYLGLGRKMHHDGFELWKKCMYF